MTPPCGFGRFQPRQSFFCPLHPEGLLSAFSRHCIKVFNPHSKWICRALTNTTGRFIVTSSMDHVSVPFAYVLLRYTILTFRLITPNDCRRQKSSMRSLSRHALNSEAMNMLSKSQCLYHQGLSQQSRNSSRKWFVHSYTANLFFILSRCSYSLEPLSQTPILSHLHTSRLAPVIGQ